MGFCLVWTLWLTVSAKSLTPNSSQLSELKAGFGLCFVVEVKISTGLAVAAVSCCVWEELGGSVWSPVHSKSGWPTVPTARV